MTAPTVAPASAAQASQAGLGTVVAALIGETFAQLDVNALDRSLPNWKMLYAAIVRRYATASATLAARQYGHARVAADVGGRFTPHAAAPPALAQIGSTVDWATAPLWSAQPDTASAQARLEAAGERLVLNAGRQTIVDNVQRDRKAKGWARVPEPGACYFCAMLATRGAVYRSERSSDFRTHDHCRCHAEPVFNAYEPSAQVREWQALYSNSTGGISGMKKMQTAWRKAFNDAYASPPQ
jgi:hypothetical protein